MTDYSEMERIRQQASMSKQLVMKDDYSKEYGWYAGASLEIADKMALIDVIKKTGIMPKEGLPFLELYRLFLDQRRKAFFSSVGSTEITKLGLMLGIKDVRVRATK